MYSASSQFVLMASACNLASGSRHVGTPNSRHHPESKPSPRHPNAQPTATPLAQPVSLNDEIGMLTFRDKGSFQVIRAERNQSSSITNTTDYSRTRMPAISSSTAPSLPSEIHPYEHQPSNLPHQQRNVLQLGEKQLGLDEPGSG